jgi:hypothetical protein
MQQCDGSCGGHQDNLGTGCFNYTDIDFDALDASYIPGTEFCFWASLADIDPFQPLTITERNEILETRYSSSGGAGTWMPLNRVADRINDYWAADD